MTEAAGTAMRLRSLLFVPGDRPDRMAKALHSGADALILDLEDAVAPGEKVTARHAVAQFLRAAGRDVALFVRINPLNLGQTSADLDAVLPARPTGLMLPKCDGAETLLALDRLLGVRGDRDTLILPIAAETPLSIFRLGDYGGATRRLAGMTWGAEDLSSGVGAATSRNADGSLASPYEIARALTLFGACAARVPPIDTVYSAIRDLDGLAAYAARAARDGFTGMLAVHPDQVPVINRAFTPSDDAVRHARDVVAAFDANPGVGAMMLHGKMIDAPHLKQAQRLLACTP